MSTHEWHTAKAAIALKAIVFDENRKILVLQRAQNDYSRPLGFDLVGGGLDAYEDPISGIKREIKEETNLEVSNIHPIDITSFREADNCFTVMIGFSCTAVTKDIILSDEHSSFQWLSAHEVLDTNIPETYKDFIKAQMKLE